MVKKIISGGQTGADQAALDAAIELGIPHGGWIPKGRKTENGELPDNYELREMPTSSYSKRTEQNAIDSDGTLIISHGKLTGGSFFTMEMAKKHRRPCLHVDLSKSNAFEAARKINEDMTDFYFEQVKKICENKIVAIVGLSYRPGVTETDFTCAHDLIERLGKDGYEVYGADPAFTDGEIEEYFKIKPVKEFTEMGAVVLMHSSGSYDEKLAEIKEKVIDVKGVLG